MTPATLFTLEVIGPAFFPQPLEKNVVITNLLGRAAARMVGLVPPVICQNRLDDVHLASSCLQKALRRSDAVHAHLAAHSLLAMDPKRLWRRLVVIVFEDFGLTDLSLT